MKSDKPDSNRRTLASIVVLLPLLVGGSGPYQEPKYPNVEDCPFEVDPNLIVGRYLGWLRVEVGQRLTHTRTWFDPEGDPATAEIVAGPEGVQLVNRPKVSAYTLLWTPRQPGIAAIVVRVTDNPSNARPQSTTGTILVQVVPRGYKPAPKGCGSPPR